MIYTLTLNPALDYRVRLSRLVPDSVMRAKDAEIRYGGKGINVSLILRELGVESVALGLAAGFTGAALIAHLDGLGLRTDFVCLPEGMTRINVKIAGRKEETELNAPGPAVPPASLAELEEKLDRLGAHDTLVMAGSLPLGLSPSTYARISKRLSARGVRIVADVSGDPLKALLTAPPFLIKPNLTELEELVGRSLRREDGSPDLAEVEEVVDFLKRAGVAHVLVTLGKDGAYLRDADGGTHRLYAPTRDAIEEEICREQSLTEPERRRRHLLELRNRTVDTVGAGDSTVAGFLCGLDQGWDVAHALRLAVAAGTATAMSEGLATREMIERVLRIMEKN